MSIIIYRNSINNHCKTEKQKGRSPTAPPDCAIFYEFSRPYKLNRDSRLMSMTWAGHISWQQ